MTQDAYVAVLNGLELSGDWGILYDPRWSGSSCATMTRQMAEKPACRKLVAFRPRASRQEGFIS
jgi:hypothetical protein